MNDPITIGYWSIRGLAAPLRMIVMYSGVPLKSVIYDDAPLPDGSFDDSVWYNEKPSMKSKNPLANLPYVQDGDMIICQSVACYLYLGRKLDLLGKSDKSLTYCEQLLMEIYGLRNLFVEFAYDVDAPEDEAVALLRRVTGHDGTMQKFELWLEKEANLGRSGGHLVDDTATAPDFYLYETLDQFWQLAQNRQFVTFWDNFPYLEQFYKKFGGLPQNQRYLNSPLAKLPINGKEAQFGATPEGGKWQIGMKYDFSAASGTF